MQKRKLGSRTIRVGWAQKNTNLFVGDLDSSVSNEMLRRAFGAFGALVIEDTFMKVRASRLASCRRAVRPLCSYRCTASSEATRLPEGSHPFSQNVLVRQCLRPEAIAHCRVGV